MTQHDSPERFTILRELGRGATGTLYAANDRSTGATVALKTLDPALLGAAGAGLIEAFLKNARSAARLRHANIVKVLDAGEAGGTAYVAMELVEGKSLKQLLAEKPLPIARAIRIFDDVASALAYAHEEGMVHRGVRPSSIFVLPSGLAKIGDFGVGQIGEAALPYQSPEQVRGDAVDQRADLFSLGVVFYEMLARRAPFGGSSPKEIRDNILRADPPRPSEVNPLVPAALDAMVLGLLARRPDDRPATARLVLRDLQRLEEALGLRAGLGPVVTPKPPPSAPPPPRPAAPAMRPAPAAEPIPPRDPEPALDFSRFTPRDEDDERYMRYRSRAPEPRSSSSTLAALALALAVLSIALTVFLNDFPVPGMTELRALFDRNKPAPTVTAAAPPPAAQPLPEAEVAPPPFKEVIPPPPPPVAKAVEPPPPPAAEAPPPPKKAAPPVEVATLPPLQEPPATTLPRESTSRPRTLSSRPRESGGPVSSVDPSPTPAKVAISVSPRGEVYVDGKHLGATPPLTTLELEPGMRRIEIRNGSRRPYLNYMVVEPGERRSIRYDFNAKGRPPA